MSEASVLAAGAKVPDPTFDEVSPELKAQLFAINCMRFRNAQDILERFPYPSQLVDEGDDIYSFDHKIIVSRDIANDIIKAEFIAAGVGSIGRDRLWRLLKDKYLCLSQPLVNNFLHSDTEAQCHRQRRSSVSVVSYIASRPSERLYVDCTDYAGGYFLTAVDAMSKFIWAVWSKYGENKSGKSAAKIADIFQSQFIPKFAGQISTLKADNGPEFGAEFDAMLARNNIKRIRGHVHTPQGNGMVERANATIKSMITSAIGQRGVNGVHASFKTATNNALKLYNKTVNPQTGWSPDMLNGDDVPQRILADVKAKLRVNSEPNEHNVKMLPKLVPGQAVRLDVLETDNALLAEYKNGTYKPTHAETWTREIYHVRTYFPSSNSVSLVEDVDVKHTNPGQEIKRSGYRFARGRVLPINTPNATNNTEPPPPAPAAPVVQIQEPVARRTRAGLGVA